ncbi:UAA transporter [Radiomyces spectabilis]|uniref:UAA transporter n=1 Tax=Radiomyces spectabilis TaxID=64574 RepID=UPI00222121CB|nr:UAA transporter [Radiomyces spectabilis]KAI8370347.1 UAA transporter [Radiomyces spectabilis]
MTSTTFGSALLHMATGELPLILSLIFGGCCSHLVTFGQFVFVAVEGLRHQLTWTRYGPRLKPTVVPLSRWLFLVVLFFLVSVLNNLALGYHISVPLHIIFRSGGLIINMAMGALILKKRYSFEQIAGVLFVTIGVIWSTIDNSTPKNEETTGSTSEFLTGIALLVIAMVLSAGMGLYQEVTYKKYGKQWREGLFYTHFLALPFFLLFYNDLIKQASVYSRSTATPLPHIIRQVPGFGSVLESLPLPPNIQTALASYRIPKLWGYLLLNVLTQYVCIAGVNRMTAVATSLTLNLVLNLRKFTSLLISIVVFDNEFGIGAKIGTALVIFGTLIYTHAGMKGSSRTTPSPDEKDKDK